MMEMAVLAHSLITAPGARPDRWLVVLHGAFGAGRNWRGVAGRLAQDRPDWGAVLVDLRLHGGSPGFAPPHTLVAAAGDVAALVRALGLKTSAVLGHSLGGKVALRYMMDRPAGLAQVWLADASPAPTDRSGDAWRMLEVVGSLPPAFASREEAVRGIVRGGFSRGVAEWMSANLARRGERFTWRLDFAALRELLEDHARTDLWPAVEDPPGEVEIHVLAATRSDVIDEAAARRLRALRDAGRRVFLHRVEGGHWLNADNPETVVALLARHLPG